jgi:hypothetical protein
VPGHRNGSDHGVLPYATVSDLTHATIAMTTIVCMFPVSYEIGQTNNWTPTVFCVLFEMKLNRIRKRRMNGAGEECVSILKCNGRNDTFYWRKEKISKTIINKYTMTVHHVTDSLPITTKTTVQTLMTVKMSKSHIESPVILVRTADVWFSE